MKKFITTVTFASPIEKVWNVVTDNTIYQWRSDLSKIVVTGENSFTEYTKDGFETNFSITKKIPCLHYEFNMKNKNMHGHWVGVFSRTEIGTQAVFTEEIKVANPILNLFVGFYFKKQKALYISDLKKALNE